MNQCSTCKYSMKLGTTHRTWCDSPLIKKLNETVTEQYRLNYHGYPLPVILKDKHGNEVYFVRFSQNGVKFSGVGWPYNYDPSFLLSCLGYINNGKN
jgi:hypothetical protein